MIGRGYCPKKLNIPVTILNQTIKSTLTSLIQIQAQTHSIHKKLLTYNMRNQLTLTRSNDYAFKNLKMMKKMKRGKRYRIFRWMLTTNEIDKFCYFDNFVSLGSWLKLKSVN